VYDFAERIFIEAGVEESSGKLTAKGLWLASLGGVDSHVRQAGRPLCPVLTDGISSGTLRACGVEGV